MALERTIAAWLPREAARCRSTKTPCRCGQAASSIRLRSGLWTLLCLARTGDTERGLRDERGSRKAERLGNQRPPPPDPGNAGEGKSSCRPPFAPVEARATIRTSWSVSSTVFADVENGAETGATKSARYAPPVEAIATRTRFARNAYVCGPVRVEGLCCVGQSGAASERVDDEASWIMLSVPVSRVGVRRLPVSTRRDHVGGSLVSAIRPLVP